MTAEQLLIAATVLGPLVGTLVGWQLHERSEQRRVERAKQQARFDVARGLMRFRYQEEMSAYLNEVPVWFGDSERIMGLWRAIAYDSSSNKARDTTHLVLAVLREVGVEGTVEQEDVERYIHYMGAPRHPAR